MRRTVRCLAASASVALLLCRTALGGAPAELEWRTPGGCPGRDYVLSEVSRLVATAPAEPLRVRALVQRRAQGYHVTIELSGAARGVRSLRARSCESVARATALIIALAIDPQAAAVVSEQVQSEPEPRSPKPLDDTPDPARAAARTRSAASPRPLVFLGFFGERALVPRLSLGAEAGFGVRWRFVRGDIAGGVIPRASATLPNNPGVSGEFTLAFVALRGCAGLIDESIAVSGCASMRGARIWSRGHGASPSFEHTAHTFSFEPGALIRVPGETGVGAELSLNLVLPLERPEFVIAEGSTQHQLFRPPPAGGVVKLALSYQF